MHCKQRDPYTLSAQMGRSDHSEIPEADPQPPLHLRPQECPQECPPQQLVPPSGHPEHLGQG
ncbi:hypothetical protein HKD37_09G024667 [Glycine soja]